MAEKENLCNAMMYMLFPTSDRAIQNEIKMVESDIDGLYKELREEQAIANELKMTLNKLNNKKIAMDPNGMTRQDAIKSTEQRAMMVLRRIKGIQNQITIFQGSKYSMENSQMTTDMRKRIKILHERMQKVKTINADELEDEIDDIADVNDYVERINNSINDTMVSAWTVDMEADEAMLQEFLASSDNEDDIESVKQSTAPIEMAIPVRPSVSTTELQIPRPVQLETIHELF